MPRPRRIITIDYFYHLYNRFVSGADLFQDKEIVELFFNEFYTSAKKYEVCIYILYCMSNHFHSLIKLTKPNLSEFIQHYSTRVSRIINQKLHRRGHIFQGRHKTQIVQTEQYLSTVVRYIFNNARRAGIVDYVEDYKWSNLNEIIKEYKTNPAYSELLEIIMNKPVKKIAIKEFIEWLNFSETGEDIKQIHHQFLMNAEQREEILKKIERRVSAGKSAKHKRKSDLSDISQLNKNLKKVVKDYYQNRKGNIPWRSERNAVLHTMWYILYEEYTARLQQIAQLYRIHRHQTISAAIERTKTNPEKMKYINEIIEMKINDKY